MLERNNFSQSCEFQQISKAENPDVQTHVLTLLFILLLTHFQQIKKLSPICNINFNFLLIYYFFLWTLFILLFGLPQWLSSEDSTCNAGDTGDTASIPGLGISPGGRHGNTFQYSCLENPMDRGAQQATVHGVTKSHTRLK